MARSRKIKVSLIKKYLDGDLSDINTPTIREDKLIELIESGRLKLKEGIDLDTQVFSEMIYNALQNDRLMKLGDEVMKMDFDDLDLDSILNQEPEAELDEDVKVDKTEIPEDVKDEQHEIQEESISSNETEIQNEEETNNEILTNEEEKEEPKVEEVGSMDEEKKVKAIRISGASIEISDEELANAGINMNLDEFADSRIVKDVAARAVSKEQFLNNLKDRINENSFEVNGEKILSYGSRLTHEQLEEIASNSKSREEFDRNIKDVSEHTLHLTGKADRRSDAMDTTSFEDAFAYAEYSTKNVYIVVRKNGEELALNISELQDKVTAKQLEDLLHESKSLEEYKNKINELVEKSRETILEAENIISEEPKKKEEAAPVVEETIPEEPKKKEEAAPVVEETIPEEPKKEEKAAPVVEETIPEEPKKEEDKPVHILLDDLMLSMGIEEVIDSESTSNEKEKSGIKMAMKLRYKGKDLDLDLDKYRVATNEEKLKMLKEACGEIDEELNKEKETETTKNYMTIKDLVNMSVDYYDKLGGKGFNTFILNGVDINIAEFAKKKNEKGEPLSVEELKQAILDHCVGVIEETHGKTREDKKDPDKKNPAEEKPAEEKPTEEKPAEEKPAEEKPTEEKPAEEKPAEEKPAEEKPAEEKPVEEKTAEDAIKQYEEFRARGLKIANDRLEDIKKIDNPKKRKELMMNYSKKLFNDLLILTTEEMKKTPEEQKKTREEKMVAFINNYKNLIVYENAMAVLYSESASKEQKDAALAEIQKMGSDKIENAMKMKTIVSQITLSDKVCGVESRFLTDVPNLGEYREYSEALKEMDKTMQESKMARDREKQEKKFDRKGEKLVTDVEGAKTDRKVASKAFREAKNKYRKLDLKNLFSFKIDGVDRTMDKSVYRFVCQNPSYDPKSEHQNATKYSVDDIERENYH